MTDCRRVAGVVWLSLPLVLACSIGAGSEGSEGPAKAGDRAEAILAEIDAKIAVAERELAEKQILLEGAAKEARYYSCRAAVERVVAAESLDKAQCLQRIASEAACQAREAQKKADTTFWGCILGIAAALGSGGAAAPYALAGCASGRLAADAAEQQCAPSRCVDGLASSQAQRLRVEGWSELPLCGGRLGLDVETPLVTGTGVRVADPGTLAAAGIQAGDYLVSLGERLTGDSARYSEALSRHAGEQVELRFVRQQQMYSGEMTLPEPIFAGARVEAAADVSCFWGARVIRADSELQARYPDLIGATISAVDGMPIASREHLREVLRYRRANETLSIELTPAGLDAVRTIQMVLRERDDNLDI